MNTARGQDDISWDEKARDLHGDHPNIEQFIEDGHELVRQHRFLRASYLQTDERDMAIQCEEISNRLGEAARLIGQIKGAREIVIFAGLLNWNQEEVVNRNSEIESIKCDIEKTSDWFRQAYRYWISQPASIRKGTSRNDPNTALLLRFASVYADQIGQPPTFSNKKFRKLAKHLYKGLGISHVKMKRPFCQAGLVDEQDI